MMFTSRKPRKMDEEDHHHGGGAGGGRGHEGGGFQKYQQRRNQYRQSKAEDINSSKGSSLQSYDHSATTDQSPQPPPTPQSYHSNSGMSHQSYSSRSSRSYYTEDDYTEDGDEVAPQGGTTNRRSYHSRGDSRRSQYTEDSRATTEYTTEGSQSRYSDDEEEGSYYTEEDDGSYSQSRSRSTNSHHRRRGHDHNEYNDESYRSEETDEDSYHRQERARGGAKSRSKHSRNHHDDTGSEPSLSPGTATSDNRDKVTVSGASAGATTLGRSVTGSSSAERTHSKSTLLSSRSTLMSSASSFRDPPGVDFSSSSSTNRKQHYKADDGTVGSSEYGRNQTPAAYRTAATSPSNDEYYHHDRRSDFDREASSGSVVSSVISALPNVPPREEGLVPSYLGGGGTAGGAGMSTTGNTAEIDSLMFDASASHIADSTVPMEDTTMADTTDPRDGSVTPSSAIMTTTSMMSDTRMDGTSRSNSYGRTSEMSFGTSGDETTTDDVTDSDIDYNTMMSREETETYRQRKEALERQRQMILNAAAAAGVSVASSSASASLSSRSGIASRTGTGVTGRGGTSIPQGGQLQQQQQQQQYGSHAHSHSTTGTSTSSYTTSEVTSATETTSSTAPSTSTHTRTTNVTPSPSQLHSTTTEEDVSDGTASSSSSSSSSSVSESESKSHTNSRSRTESTPSSSTPSSSAGRHLKKKTIGNVLGKKAVDSSSNVQKTAAASTASSSIMSNKEKNPLIIDHERKKTMLESLSELTKLQKAVSDLTLPADLQSTSKGGTGGDNTANSSVVSSTHEVNSTHNKDDSETRATPSSLSESTGTTPSRHQRNVEQAAALQQQQQQKKQQQSKGGRFYVEEQPPPPHMSRIVERGESKITDNEDTESTGTYEVKHRIESELEACKQLLANAESSKTGAARGSATGSSKRHNDEQAQLHRQSHTSNKPKAAETTTAEERKLRLLREGIQVGAMATRTSEEDKDLSDLTMSVVANYSTTPRDSQAVPTGTGTVKQQEGDKAAGVGVITAAAAARAAAMSPSSSSAVPQSQQAALEEDDAANDHKHGKHHRHHHHHHHHHSKRGDDEDDDDEDDDEEEDESETGWSSEDDSSSTHSLNRSRGGGTHKSSSRNARSRGGDGSNNSTTSGHELPETHIPFQKKKPKPMPGATEHICQDDDEERSQILFGGDALLLRPPEPVAPELLKTSSGEVHPPVVVATVSAEDHMREKQKQLLQEANAAAAAESTATATGGGSTTVTRGSGSGKLSPEDLDDLLADDEPEEDEHPHPLKMAGVAGAQTQMLHSAPSGALLQKDRSLFSIASSFDESSGTRGSSDRRDQFRMRKLTPDAGESHSTFYTESSRSEFTSGERSEDTNGTPQSQTTSSSTTEHSESRSEYTEEEESYVSTTTEDESESKDRSRGGRRRRPLRSHASGTASTSDGEGTPSTAQGSSSRTGHTSVSGTLSKTSSTSFIQTAQFVREGSDTEEEEEDPSGHKYHQKQHFQRSKHSSRSDYSSKSGRSRNDGGSSYVSSRSATPVSSDDEYDDDEERGNYKRREQQMLSSSNKAYQGRSTRSDSTHEGHHDDEFIKPPGGGRRFSIGSRSPKGNRGSPPGAAGGNDTHSVHSAGNASRSSSFQKNGHWCCTPWYKPLIIGAFCIAIVAGVITAVALILTTKGGSVVQQQQGTDGNTNVDVKQNGTITGTGTPPPTDIELHDGSGSSNASTAFANLEWNIVSTLMDTEFSSPGDGAGSQVIMSQDGTKTIVSSPLWSSPNSKHVGSVTIYDTSTSSDDGRSNDGTSTIIARLTGSSREERFGSVFASNANATLLAIGSLLIDDSLSSEALSNTAARETTAEASSVTVKGFEVTLHRLSGDSTATATLEPVGEPLLIDLGDQFSFPLLTNEELNNSALSLSFSEDGTRLLVGTPLLIEEVSRSVFSGRLWIYDVSEDKETPSSVWNEMSILKGSEPSGYIYNDKGYGSSNVIISGDGQTIAVVGSLTSSSSSPEPQQVIHLLKYDVDNQRWGKWNDLFMLNMFINHQEELEAFSSDDQIMSIDMNYDGTILVVGVASASPERSNYVVAFDLMKTFENDTNAMIDNDEANTAQLIGQVLMGPDADDTFFGYSLDLSSDGTRLAVGSPGGGSSTSGVAVYLYEYNKDETKKWIQALAMGEETTTGGTYQGYSVSLSDNDHIAIGVPNLNGCDVSSVLPKSDAETTTDGGPSFCEAGFTQIYQYLVPTEAKEASLDVMVDNFFNDENETEAETEIETTSSGSSVVTLKDGLPEEASWPGCIIDQMTCEGCRAMIQAERKDLQVDIVREAPSKEDSTGKRYLLRKRQMSDAQETTTTIENKKRYLRRQMVEQDDSTTKEDNTSAVSTVVQVICSDDDRVLEEPKWNVQDLKN